MSAIGSGINIPLRSFAALREKSSSRKAAKNAKKPHEVYDSRISAQPRRGDGVL